MFTQGQIVKNILINEPVKITQVQKIGTDYAITFSGINSNQVGKKMLSEKEIEQCEIISSDGLFDFTGNPLHFKLFAEAERIHSAYQFDPLYAVNCSIVDPLPHQVEAVYKHLLPLPKIRFLLADDTGAGKTIMTGLILKELLARGIIERILIITPGGLTKQWQEDELGFKFNMNFKLVNRSIFTAEPTVFHFSNRVVSSMDFISRPEIMEVLIQTHWDIIVFDEAHKLSAYTYGNKKYFSQRYQAAYQLSKQCEHLLLLTATPHRGRADTFQMLLQLLDEDIFATNDLAETRVKEIEQNGINRFFIRRLKEDMKDWNGKPLYKDRFTQTVSYELTEEEKQLYDEVTNYLTKRKAEAAEEKNIHVSLALTVMQRRLASSLFAIKNTLERRWKSLLSLVEDLEKNPSLWKEKHKLDNFDITNEDDYDDLEDEERDLLERLLNDPKKFKLFTTSKNIDEIRTEANELKRLFEMAKALVDRNQEEKKFHEVQKILRDKGVLENKEKLVIFTEHKDTLDYLKDRLSKSHGYQIATIHGGMSVDERRQAQLEFYTPDVSILIATDAAGEGINLQFCRLLINWDIPWNPNRLEQRMGRIHRYGQKQDVFVFNLVASNTREGAVLKRLLSKLDNIRRAMGDDRVYDVIQDVLENIPLEKILQSVLNGAENEFSQFLSKSDDDHYQIFREKINNQKKELARSSVDYKEARELKDLSDEKRLQPIYIRLFFETAFNSLGGKFTEVRKGIYRIEYLPSLISEILKNEYNLNPEIISSIKFCFDKQIFLEFQNFGDIGRLQFINPGNILFDSLLRVVIQQYRESMLKGTVLVSAEDTHEHFAYLVKSQITDNRSNNNGESVADEKLSLVFRNQTNTWEQTSPAKIIDLKPPLVFAKTYLPPSPVQLNDIEEWSYLNITKPQYDEAQSRIRADIDSRKRNIDEAFTQLLISIQQDISDLQGKLLFGDPRSSEKLIEKEKRYKELIDRKKVRLSDLERMTELSKKPPEVLGCAYIIPLSKLEYESFFGMSRDEEVETIAMNFSMDFEMKDGWVPTDVSKLNEGYDIRSLSPEHLKRYIEVKGRSDQDGNVFLTENEMNRLAQLGETAWLYIVLNCKSIPELYRIRNPAKVLQFTPKGKGIQYFLAMEEWKKVVR